MVESTPGKPAKKILKAILLGDSQVGKTSILDAI